MEMNNIQKTLENVLGGTFSGIHTYYLQYLIQLVGYYSEDDLSEKEKEAFNQLNALLIKYAELNHLISAIHYTLGNNEKNTSAINLFIAMKDAIFQVDAHTDVAALICYVKRKATEAGDWPLKYEN